MKRVLIAVAVGVCAALAAPAAAQAAVKPRPPVIAPCPSWAPNCKPVVVHAPPAPRWLSAY